MKMETIGKALSAQFAERDDVIEGLLVSLVARQHVLLIGVPGTAKSALISELARRITGADYFQWLLTRFSTPEELFGPVSLKALEQGLYQRNASGKLPEAHLAFLDEIFKANSAILNSLLTLINERLFYNGGAPIRTPLQSLIGASNEYPEEGEGLEALFDRFLMRFELDYIAEEQAFVSMLKGSSSVPAAMTIDELYELQFLSDAVHVPDDVFEALAAIRRELKQQSIRPSDRRFKQSLSLIRAKAVLSGRPQAEPSDLLVLKSGLWEKPDQKDAVGKIVAKYAQDSVKLKLEELRGQLKGIVKDTQGKTLTTDQTMDVTQKLKALRHGVQLLAASHPGRKEIAAVEQALEKTLQEIASQALGV